MAEFIMKDIVKKAGKEYKYEISSSATSSEELGNPIYYPAREELIRRGVPFDKNKRATKLTSSAYDKYDYFLVMDDYNYVNILKIFGSDPEKKIRKLLDFENGGEISDPWYTDRFDIAFNDISRGCKAFYAYSEQNVPRETNK